MTRPGDAPWDVPCRCGHRYARHVASAPDMLGYTVGCQEGTGGYPAPPRCRCDGYVADLSDADGVAPEDQRVTA